MQGVGEIIAALQKQYPVPAIDPVREISTILGYALMNRSNGYANVTRLCWTTAKTHPSMLLYVHIESWLIYMADVGSTNSTSTLI